MSQKMSATMIVNIGAAGIALALIGYGVVTTFVLEGPPPGCMAHYARTATFDLTSSNGGPISLIELQARAGNGERNIVENARIVPVSDGPAPAALEIKLGLPERATGSDASGVLFKWRPMAGDRASAACLRYNLFMPDDFDFASGGSLPGLVGGDVAQSGSEAKSGFELSTRWQHGGTVGFVLRAPEVQPQGSKRFDNFVTTLPRGRWVSVEQELRLDKPGAEDGELRVWLDGSLVVDKSGLDIHKDADPVIDAVHANVGFVVGPRKLPQGEAGTLRLSPIELAWK